MAKHTPTPTKFGRVHVAEPFSSILRLHQHNPAVTLKAVAHPPKVPVLDQEDLQAQGIDTSRVIPGAPVADALGSCVANATLAAVSTVLTRTGAEALAQALPGAALAGDPVADEKTAIRLYHALTDQTGEPATEWPPTDCGSSGLWACKWLESHQVITGHRIAHGADSIVSLMQTHALITGQPWLNAWMTPGSDGFIDGDGSPQRLAEDINGGVAGGHEACWYGIDSLATDEDGHVDPDNTVIRFRNSWSPGWALDGDGLAHLSTFIYLARWCDHRAFLAGQGTAGDPIPALAAQVSQGVISLDQARRELGISPFNLPATGGMS